MDQNSVGTSQLDVLYQKYFKSLSKADYTALLLEIRDYALRITANAIPLWVSGKIKEIPKLRDQRDREEAAQISILKVHRALQNPEQVFRGESSFRHWIHIIIVRSAIDVERKVNRKQEVRLPEWKSFLETTIHDDFSDESDAGSAVAISRRAIEKTENELNDALDLKASIENLPEQDREIAEANRLGVTPEEFAKQRGIADRKRVYKQFENAKRNIRLEVIVHTCKLEDDPTYKPQADKTYTRVDSHFRPLADKCRCKKLVTRQQAHELISSGQAQEIYVSRDGKVTADPCRIWASQNVRVQRAKLTSYVDNIEEAHRLALEARLRLIVPFRPDPFEGRSIAAPSLDKRTRTRSKTHILTVPPPKPIPAGPIHEISPQEGNSPVPAVLVMREENPSGTSNAAA